MNVRTDRQKDRQTDKPHELHVYVGLAQARPNHCKILYKHFQNTKILLMLAEPIEDTMQNMQALTYLWSYSKSIR